MTDSNRPGCFGAGGYSTAPISSDVSAALRLSRCRELVNYGASLDRMEINVAYFSPDYYFMGDDEKTTQFDFAPGVLYSSQKVP